MYSKNDPLSCNTLVRFNTQQNEKDFTRHFGKISGFSFESPSLPNCFWVYNNTIYFSNGDEQYKMNPSSCEFELNLSAQKLAIYSPCVWSDGTNQFYSNNSTQYKLNEATLEWEGKEWKELTSFSGEYCWTDGEHCYYSNGSSTQYILGDDGITWETKAWTTSLIPTYGNYVWNFGGKTYYSNGSTQYVLNSETGKWETTSWNDVSFYGNDIFVLNNTIYRKSTSDIKYWNSSSSIWSTTKSFGVSSSDRLVIAGSYAILFEDGGTYYRQLWGSNGLSSSSAYFVSLADTTLTPDHVLKTDNGFYYSPYNHAHYKWNDAETHWNFDREATWLWGNIRGEDVWTDGEHYYYSNGTETKLYNSDTKKWEKIVFEGQSDFYGRNVWTDGNDVFLWDGFGPYRLNKEKHSWEVIESEQSWSSSTIDSSIWHDGEKFYAYSGKWFWEYDDENNRWEPVQTELSVKPPLKKFWYKDDRIFTYDETSWYEWDKTEKNWEYLNYLDLTGGDFSNTPDFNIFETENNTYLISSRGYQDVSECAIYRLEELTENGPNWASITISGDNPYMTFSAIWSDGKALYCESEGNTEKSTYHYFLNEEELKWEAFESTSWPINTDPSTLEAQNFWEKDGVIYYSDGYYHANYVFDEATGALKTYFPKGLNKIYGRDIWTDGKNVHYSHEFVQRVLNEDGVWVKKEWENLRYFYGSNVWTDGDAVYYSEGSYQYVLQDNTWIEKAWKGLTYFNGTSVVKVGGNVYLACDTYAYRLDKDTDTWIKIAQPEVNENSLPINSALWTDGKKLYYSYNTNQMIYDEANNSWFSSGIEGQFTIYSYNVKQLNGKVICNSLQNSGRLLQFIEDTKTFKSIKVNPLPKFTITPYFTRGSQAYTVAGSNWYSWDSLTKHWTYLYGNTFSNVSNLLFLNIKDEIYCFYQQSLYVLPVNSENWGQKTTSIKMASYPWNGGSNYLFWYNDKPWRASLSIRDASYWDSEKQTWITPSVEPSTADFCLSAAWSDGKNAYANGKKWNKNDITVAEINFSENREDVYSSDIYHINNRIFLYNSNGLWELLTKDDLKTLEYNCDGEWLTYYLRPDTALPVEVATESEMTALLDAAEIGGVYKYTGKSGTYENGALYTVEEYVK